MKAILQNSFLLRAARLLWAWFLQSAIADFFRAVRTAYLDSVIFKWWKRICATPACAETSGYMKLLTACRRLLERITDMARQSLLFRFCCTVKTWGIRLVTGGMIGRLLQFLGVRGTLLAALALYLPLDYIIRAVMPSFVASVWDECLMLAAFLYVLWRMGSRRGPMRSRATTFDGYLWLFICMGFFLMCTVSPIMSIAISGYRAVVQYMFWFFLVLRLLEDDRDFTIFYGTLVLMAVLIALHGIYQFIVAAPIPAEWMTQTEKSVRTRVYSLTGSPNIMGSFLVMFAPMVAGIAYYSKNRRVQTLAVCTTGMMCLSCLFTFSKGAWAGLAVAIVVFALFIDRRLIAMMTAAGLAAFALIPSVANRILFVFTPAYVQASQTGGRMLRWKTGLTILHYRADNPLLGFGLGRFGGAVAMQNQVLGSVQYFYMDNYYLKTLVEMGYIGLFFYIILLVALVLWCLRAIGRSPLTKENRSRVLPVSMFSGMAGVLMHCYFENIFEVPYMTAYFWSLAAAVLYIGFFRTPGKNAKAIPFPRPLAALLQKITGESI